VHWLCIILYTPVIYYNYESIAEVGHGGSHKCSRVVYPVHPRACDDVLKVRPVASALEPLDWLSQRRTSKPSSESVFVSQSSHCTALSVSKCG
jgi:hypothetical protein